MSAASPTRRALMGGAMLAAATAVPALSAPCDGMAELRHRLDARERARATLDAYRVAHFDPMEERLHEARRAIPHRQTIATYVSNGDPKAVLSTEGWHVVFARRVVAEPAGLDADFLTAARELIDLAEEREARLAELDARFNVEAITARENALLDADTEALEAVLLHPSATIAEVLAKLRFIIAEDAWELTPAQDGITADLERIGGAA